MMAACAHDADAPSSSHASTYNMAGPMQQLDDPSPLGIMLAAMLRRWHAGEEDRAVALACAAAPYLHRRRGVMGAHETAPTQPEQMSDEQLEFLLKSSGAGGGAAAEGEVTSEPG